MEAATTAGAGDARIILRHIFAHSLGPIVDVLAPYRWAAQNGLGHL